MAILAKRPLPRRVAIGLALGVMWLGGSIGLWLLHLDGGWNFILLNGHDIGTVGQIGAYYLARVGALIPSVGMAVMIIGMAEFEHPLRTASVTVLGYHGVLTLIRLLFGRAWRSVPNLDQRVPAVAELAQLALLVGQAALFKWITFLLNAWLKTNLRTR